MNSLTVNLHLMMVSFYRPTTSRFKILIERGAFPSDQYAVKSQIRFHGLDPAASLMELTPGAGGRVFGDEEIESLIDREGESIALVLLGGVHYGTGQAFDMARITRAGPTRAAALSASTRPAPPAICRSSCTNGLDFAVWCNYKIVNGGPGCIAGCFVHERHAKSWDLPRFAGWWGHDENVRFEMGPNFQPMAGAEGWQLSNPPIVSLAAVRASMDIFHEVGMQRLRAEEFIADGLSRISVGATGCCGVLDYHAAGKRATGCSTLHTNYQRRESAVRAARPGGHHRRLARTRHFPGCASPHVQLLSGRLPVCPAIPGRGNLNSWCCSRRGSLARKAAHADYFRNARAAEAKHTISGCL